MMWLLARSNPARPLVVHTVWIQTHFSDRGWPEMRNLRKWENWRTILGAVNHGVKKKYFKSKCNVDDTGSSPEKVGLISHNNYRQTHKAPPMQLDSGLNSDAMRYAKKLAQKGSLEHDKTTDEGENLGYQCRPGSDAELVEAVVDSWWVSLVNHLFIYLQSLPKSFTLTERTQARL